MPSTGKMLHPAKAAPHLHIPAGNAIRVRIIDSTSRIKAPVAYFMRPLIEGHDQLMAPAYSFLIEQKSSSRKILFDLGLRKDWQNHPPAVQSIISGPGWEMSVEKNVAEILQENNVDVAGGAIEAVIWSHWHFDHTGDVITFPHATKLITGPGVRDAFLPGFPANPESPLVEADFEGREHVEIDFDSADTVQVGNFRAVDYFKDGSFYILDAPGHAVGHICGLARVTSTKDGDAEDTFIFMGADTCHHGGEFRPSEYMPLPVEISPSPYVKKYPSTCPGHVFEALHPIKKGVEPYYHIHDGLPHSKEQADISCENMQQFDIAENVFVIIAHDESIIDPGVGIALFPRGDVKNWKKEDQANKVRWAFLKDFTLAVEKLGY
ncbi:hypothetical protein MYCGRDRAFT_67907 [Paecilomyces variotii No. 5]|uniref:Metallo-beta-lactamase domain-containing protein n=1 Tax=Byssochlamys spectabilis (strain No. 5 / NBRC 109023) TaxID=1356009 RepID=V5FZA6_BYSSN|nr:hypothetical protein MYCGRDRAFT_67907 [Paecilomyces variotii No. 5]